MFKLAGGGHVHPAIKALIGAAVLIVGLTRHGAAGLVVMGTLALAWAAIDAAGSWRRARKSGQL
jgi:hypothetical protein